MMTTKDKIIAIVFVVLAAVAGCSASGAIGSLITRYQVSPSAATLFFFAISMVANLAVNRGAKRVVFAIGLMLITAACLCITSAL